MPNRFLHSYPPATGKALSTLVENRIAHTFEMCELNMYETFEKAVDVNLRFNNFALSTMLTGKKVMRLTDKPEFEYHPGESLVIQPDQLLSIDFPEARMDNPTQCMALTLSDDVITQTIDQLNEFNPLHSDWGHWNIDRTLYHFTNSQDFTDAINRILKISQTKQGKAKDLMVELTVRELLIHLMQTQARLLFTSARVQNAGDNSLVAVLDYISRNLSSKIELNQLSEIACMSRATFFKKFKEALGVTPLQFIIKERLQLAQVKLKNTNKSITEVCYSCGFENLSHFITAFKNEFGLTPKCYKNSDLNNA